jgi:peptidoglycan/xylan/chitin deacetylase (PgdA/CDA1 family)
MTFKFKKHIIFGMIVILLILLTLELKYDIFELKSGQTMGNISSPAGNQDVQDTPGNRNNQAETGLAATEEANRPDSALSAGNENKFPEAGIPVLMYHSISTIPGNSLGVPVQQFTEEMEWLHSRNYHTLSLEEFYQALVNQAPVPDKPVLLTFDDGYVDNYTSAWPVLRQYGFRATFFIISNSIGNDNMNWDQLHELVLQGNSIGCHTVHHYDLSALSGKQLENELTVSKQELENRLGVSIYALCFPSGRYNSTTLELIPKLGYKLGFTTISGKVHPGDELMTLKRIRISGGMPLASFQSLMP